MFVPSEKTDLNPLSVVANVGPVPDAVLICTVKAPVVPVSYTHLTLPTKRIV